MKLALTPANRWPVAITAVLLAQVAFGVWMSRVAGSDPHFAVEPDYYARAINWDATMAQSRKDKALGWTAQASFEHGASGPVTVRVMVRERTGAPVAADSVTAHALAVAHAGTVDTLVFTRSGEGYTATVPGAARGIWEFELRAVRGFDVFTDKLRAELQ